MKIKSLVLLALAISVAVMAIPQVFAHSHVDAGVAGCVALPNSWHGEDAIGNSSKGIGTAANTENAAVDWGSCVSSPNRLNVGPYPFE